jgi:DNA-binding HxlR family transcriptional regulator
VRYEELADFPCSITRPLVVLGDRWTLLVLKTAFNGVRRFNAFQSALGISRSRLQDRLDRLVEHGILTKQRAAEGNYEEYRLTPKGQDVYPILMALRDWGDR